MARKSARIVLLTTEELKAQAKEASKEIRGGLSRVIRDLLVEWLKKKTKKSG